MGIAHGTGIGIGLFLLLIAANGVGMVIKNPLEGLPVALGAFTSFPVLMSLLGLAVIFGLEKCRVHWRDPAGDYRHLDYRIDI